VLHKANDGDPYLNPAELTKKRKYVAFCSDGATGDDMAALIGRELSGAAGYNLPIVSPSERGDLLFDLGDHITKRLSENHAPRLHGEANAIRDKCQKQAPCLQM
jgi:hypothetical protein